MKISNSQYKITADTHRPDKSFENKGYEILDRFILPASMNVRDVLKKEEIIDKDLTFKNYKNCCEFIRKKFVLPVDSRENPDIEACRSDSENIIVDNFDKFVNGIEVKDVKLCFENYYGYYEPRKFKIFQSEIKNKLKNEGNYRVVLSDGRRPTIYKLKEKFVEEYKNEAVEE